LIDVDEMGRRVAVVFRCKRTLKSKILFYCFSITVVILSLVIAICLTNFNLR
jgi:hypothetical protein